MPAKKKQNGKGILDVLKYAKDNKLLSRGLGLFPHPGTQAASVLAGLVGLGKKKKTRKRTQRGKGIFGDIGGGLGSALGGLGGGIGSAFHGLFGGKKKRAKKNVLVM